MSIVATPTSNQAFAAGWFGRTLQQPGDRQLALDSIIPQAQHVILHIVGSDEARFETLLQKTRTIPDEYSAQGVQVEVVTRAGGKLNGYRAGTGFCL